MKRDYEKELKDKDEVIRALTLIRENYEKKFGIRMFANGEFKKIKKGKEA